MLNIKTMITIVLNPEEAQRLDYEYNWKNLVSFEDYLAIKAQQGVIESNQKDVNQMLVVGNL